MSRYAVEALQQRLDRVEAAIQKEHRESLMLAQQLRASHSAFDGLVSEQRELREALLVLADGFEAGVEVSQ